MKKEIVSRDYVIGKLTQYATTVAWAFLSNSALEENFFLLFSRQVHIKRWYEFWLKL